MESIANISVMIGLWLVGRKVIHPRWVFYLIFKYDAS
jgi:hypothetical protein